MLIFFVTGRCNSRCTHCFNWKNLGPDRDGLPLSQVESLARSMPSFRTLLLSGGEPTLRDDLVQIVELFLRHAHIATVGVPVNGLLPRRTVEAARAIAALDSQLRVTFNVSIEGFAPVNDPIRGIPGDYERALETLAGLQDLAAGYSNLRVFINTVISAANLRGVLPFAEYVASEGLADGHFFELVRGDPPDVRLKALPAADLSVLYRRLLHIQDAYLRREGRRSRGSVLGYLRYVSDMGNLVNKYRHQLAAHGRDRRWDFPCVAGEGIGVVDYDGGLRVCELRDRRISLQDYGFDFAAAWGQEALRDETVVAASHVCDCTHTCFLGASMRHDPVSRYVVSPWWYLRHRLGMLW